jgi:hypothetical protein
LQAILSSSLLGAISFYRHRGLQKSSSPNDIIPKDFYNNFSHYITLIIIIQTILESKYFGMIILGKKYSTTAQATPA